MTMKTFYPHIFFWLTALSIILIGEFSIQNISNVIDINIHDTYYVISRKEISIVFSSLFLLIGFIYWLFQKTNIKLNRNLTRFHTIVSIGAVLVYYAFLIYYRYIKTESLFEPSNETYINLILIFTALLIQVHFVYNIFHSIIRYSAQKKSDN